MTAWGPYGWAWLHALAFSWRAAPTRRERDEMRAFLLAFGDALPCPSCASHFGARARAMLAAGADAPALRDARALSRALYELHDEVNVRLGKSHRPTFAEVERAWAARLGGRDVGGAPSPPLGLPLAAVLVLVVLVISAVVHALVIARARRTVG